MIFAARSLPYTTANKLHSILAPKLSIDHSLFSIRASFWRQKRRQAPLSISDLTTIHHRIVRCDILLTFDKLRNVLARSRARSRNAFTNHCLRGSQATHRHQARFSAVNFPCLGIQLSCSRWWRKRKWSCWSTWSNREPLTAPKHRFEANVLVACSLTNHLDTVSNRAER